MLIFLLESSIRDGAVGERGGGDAFVPFISKIINGKRNNFASNVTIPAAPYVQYYLIFIMIAQYSKNTVATSNI